MKKLYLLILSLTFVLPQIKAETSIEDRIYILSSVWRNVHENFAFPQHFKHSNPDSLYKEFLPKVMNARTETEFSLLMTEFLARFGDAHTRFFAETPTATVPIKFTGIDNHVYVKNIGKDYMDIIPIGSQLIKIDRKLVEDYLKTEIYPYVSAANEDWKFRKSLDSFLNGDENTEVVLEFLTPKHKTETVTFKRVEPQILSSYDWGKTEDNRAAYVEKLRDNIAYMRMATFTAPAEVNQVFKENLPLFRNSKGLIFDIRGNRGGSDESWNPMIFDYIAPVDKDINAAFLRKCRVANSAFHEYGSQIPQLKEYATETAMDVIRTGGSYFSQVHDSLKIKCPIVIITDGYTGSAAEDFAATMKNLELAQLVGSHTVGVISHPRYFDLPNGDSYGLSTWAFYNPDGSGMIETGIIPDIEVEYTLKDLICNDDSQLEKAIESLINTYK